MPILYLTPYDSAKAMPVLALREKGHAKAQSHEEVAQEELNMGMMNRIS